MRKNHPPIVAPPVGRGSSAARPAAPPVQQSATDPTAVEKHQDTRPAPDQEPPRSGTLHYGSSPVRMAFVFMGAEEYQRIAEAAEADGDKVGTWMANVLNDAARARLEFRDQERDQEHKGDCEPPV